MVAAGIPVKRRRIWCTPENWQKLEEKAGKAGMPVSRLLMLCCTHGLDLPDESDLAGKPGPITYIGEERAIYSLGGMRWSVGVEMHAAGIGETVLELDEVLKLLRRLQALES